MDTNIRQSSISCFNTNDRSLFTKKIKQSIVVFPKGMEQRTTANKTKFNKSFDTFVFDKNHDFIDADFRECNVYYKNN